MMEERRLHPRRVVHDESAMMPASLNVRVLDISLAGVLLQSSKSVRLGASGRLNLSFEGQPFRADVQVQRVVGLDAGSGFHLAATFVGLHSEERRLIERYMAQE